MQPYLLSMMGTSGDVNLLVPSIAAAVLLVVLTALLWNLLFHQNGKGGKPYPPLAPASMLQTMSSMQGNDLPWFYLKMAEDLGNKYTYRLSLPFPHMFVVTGDPKLAREVLTDPKSTKPALYRQFEAEGIGNIFTRNGAFWVRAKLPWLLHFIMTLDVCSSWL
jgi:hypothetical protein